MDTDFGLYCKSENIQCHNGITIATGRFAFRSWSQAGRADVVRMEMPRDCKATASAVTCTTGLRRQLGALQGAYVSPVERGILELDYASIN